MLNYTNNSLAPAVCQLTIVIVGLFVTTIPSESQPVTFTYPSYGLEVHGDNVIHNAAHLVDFYEALSRLYVTGQGRVNIVHIGDSHLQADFMTRVIRTGFHRDFGNAGRGLIVPLRIAGTNEPGDYRTSSNRKWNAKRCVFPDQPLPIGIGGVTIESTDPDTNLQVKVLDPYVDYTFNKMTLFFLEDESAFDFSVTTSSREFASIKYQDDDSTGHRATVEWESLVDGVTLQTHAEREAQHRSVIFGMVLEKRNTSGVLYHTIGVNGAKYRHYNVARHFAEQTAALCPDLFIISLGTNESVDYPRIENGMLEEIGELVTALKKHNPGAGFLLVTPPDAFRKRDKPNPGIREVREKILRYAVDNGLAFYDMYRATGGDGAASRWKENALLSHDGIHFTREGYIHQGHLFYHALIKGFNAYVSD